MIELSFTALKIIKAFCSEPKRTHHGYGFVRTISVSKQAAYPILKRLTEEGWLSDAGMQESTCKQRVDGHATRKTYRMTDMGLREGLAALAALQLSSTVLSECLKSPPIPTAATAILQ